MVINNIYKTIKRHNNKMVDTVLGTTVKEKDLGVTISADMKVSEQFQRVIKFLG